jgi:CRP-like cAMP-binding protein
MALAVAHENCDIDGAPGSAPAMIDQFIRRLRQGGSLSAAAITAVQTAIDRRVRLFGAREDLFRPGDTPHSVCLVTAGIACRYRLLPSGQRQITGFLLPGDLFALRASLAMPFDHSIRSLTMLEMVQLERSALSSCSDPTSGMAEVLSRAMALQLAISREWVLNLGQRSAMERIAHLFCELFRRLQAVGLTIENQCLLPLTQIDIADAVGLTPVHVNRMVMSMTRSGWLTFQHSLLEIRDMIRVAEIGSFDASYLDPGGPFESDTRPGLQRRLDPCEWQHAGDVE